MFRVQFKILVISFGVFVALFRNEKFLQTKIKKTMTFRVFFSSSWVLKAHTFTSHCDHGPLSLVEDHGHIQPKSSNSGVNRNSDTAFKDTMTKRMCLTLGHLMNDDLYTVLMLKVTFTLHS